MKPYKFVPYVRETLWGGESWQLSAVPGHVSMTPEGESLTDIIAARREMLMGERLYARFGTNFPLLVKFIDAHDDLSLQVHPNDVLAARRHNCPGKSEMWYVIRAEEKSRIYAGLSKPLTPAEYERAVTTEGGGRVLMDAVACHESHPGDVFYLPAGRLHAIGAGNFLAEIQQTSDITYRVYDFDRVGSDGQKRELHTEQAKDAIDYRIYPAYRTSYDTAGRVVELVDCPYFWTHRIVLKSHLSVDLKTDSFVVLVCIAGTANVNGVSVTEGETMLVPACTNILEMHGHALFLSATA